jgi:hypothetical protein
MQNFGFSQVLFLINPDNYPNTLFALRFNKLFRDRFSKARILIKTDNLFTFNFEMNTK